MVIICASYLQPWHLPPCKAIWAKREGTCRLLWKKFFDFRVQWCGNYGHMCFTVSHACSASLCLIIFHIYMLTGVWSVPNVFSLSGLCDLCMLKQYGAAHLYLNQSEQKYSFVLQKEQCLLTTGNNDMEAHNEITMNQIKTRFWAQPACPQFTSISLSSFVSLCSTIHSSLCALKVPYYTSF